MRSITTLDLQYAHRFYGFKGEAQYLHGHTGVPVSYTHLDVYKRQVHHRVGNSVQRAVAKTKQPAQQGPEQHRRCV